MALRQSSEVAAEGVFETNTWGTSRSPAKLPQYRATSSMSLYTHTSPPPPKIKEERKKKNPFASHKQFRLQLRKHRVNHMAGVAQVGCIFPQTKRELRVEGKEKKTQLSGWWSCCLEAMIPNLTALFQAPTETWYVTWLASFIFTRVVRAAGL